MDIVNECGGCTACCKVMGVTGFKPEFTVCQHAVKGKGCAIYATRPDGCKGFECLWRYGVVGGPECRPDKIGLVLVPTLDQSRVQAMEVWPGAASGDGRGRAILESIRPKMDVIVVRERGTRTLLTVEGRPQPAALKSGGVQ